MKRMLFVVAVLGALALITTAVSQASQRAARQAAARTAQVECNAACPIGDGSACPSGCPLCSSKHGDAAATVTSAAR